MSEGTTASVVTFFIASACVGFLVTLCVEVKGCNESSDRANVEVNAARQRTMQACIASNRTAAECSVLLGRP